MSPNGIWTRVRAGTPRVGDVGRAAGCTGQQLAGYHPLPLPVASRGPGCRAHSKRLPLTLCFFWDLERRRKMVKAASPSPTPGFSRSFPVWTHGRE